MTVRLMILNRTDYSGRDLRAVFLECMKHEGMNRCKVEVRKSRGKNVGGYAWYHSVSVVMKLPTKFTIYKHHYCRSSAKVIEATLKRGWGMPKCELLGREKHEFCINRTVDGGDEMPREMVERVAQVFIHEMHHNIGLKHKEMKRSTGIDVSYVKGMKIRRKVVAEKPNVEKVSNPKKDIKMIRYEKALTKVRQRPIWPSGRGRSSIMRSVGSLVTLKILMLRRASCG